MKVKKREGKGGQGREVVEESEVVGNLYLGKVMFLQLFMDFSIWDSLYFVNCLVWVVENRMFIRSSEVKDIILVVFKNLKWGYYLVLFVFIFGESFKGFGIKFYIQEEDEERLIVLVQKL